MAPNSCKYGQQEWDLTLHKRGKKKEGKKGKRRGTEEGGAGRGGKNEFKAEMCWGNIGAIGEVK